MTMHRAFFVSLLLAASCQQGGSAPPPAPAATFAPDVEITAGNAIGATRAGVRAAFDFVRLAYIGAEFLTAERPGPEPGSAESVVPGASYSREYTGPKGGLATMTWDDQHSDGVYSTDDRFTIAFDGYVDGEMTLDGVLVIEDFRMQGVLPSNGTWWVDATLHMLGLDVTLGSEELTFDLELPFHLENRQLVEIFDLFQFEDRFFGGFEIKRNTRWLRYENENEIMLSVDGYVYSPQLDGLLRFMTPSVMRFSTFNGNPVEGFVKVLGAGQSYLEAEPTSICSLPIPLPCSLDVRVDEDGDETFEATLSVTLPELLPQ